MLKFLALLVAGTLAHTFAAPAARAQDYPNRPIVMVCSFAAGSGADVLARYYANKLAEVSGATVIVENKPGAAGNIGTDSVAHAKPDGYRILIAPNSVLAAAPHLFSNLSFNPLKDFRPVAALAQLSFVFAVNGNSPARSMADLTQQLAEKGSKGFYGATTNTGIVAAELYKNAKSLKTERIPYKNVADALGGISQNEVDFIVFDSTWTLGQVRSGKLRALAVTTDIRSTSFPDTPTMKELGHEGFDLTPWWGIVAPRGVPNDVVDKLTKWFEQIATTDETKAFLERSATQPFTISRDEMQRKLEKETAQWARYIELAKIERQ